MVVVEIAKSGRASCRTCLGLIEQDSLKIGTTVSNEGFINVEWHHSQCFWTKTASRYYYRKNKKINTVLKYDQFSGVEKLTEAQRQEIQQRILEANFKWATDQALQKAGIVRDSSVLEGKETAQHEVEEGEPIAEEEFAPKSTKGKGKGKRGIEQISEEEDVAAENEKAGKKPTNGRGRRANLTAKITKGKGGQKSKGEEKSKIESAANDDISSEPTQPSNGRKKRKT